MGQSSGERSGIDPYLQNKIFILVQVFLALLCLINVFVYSQGIFAALVSGLGLVVIAFALYRAQNSVVSPFLVKLSWFLLWLACQWSLLKIGTTGGQMFLLYAIGFSVFTRQQLWLFFGLGCLALIDLGLSAAILLDFLMLALFLVLCQGVRDALDRNARTLEEVSQQDPATGCLSSTALEAEMHRAFGLNKRYDAPCTAIALEFRVSEVNDMQSEKQVLQELVKVWRSRLRQTDLLFRLSDTRFICLLPSTNQEQALVLQQDLERASRAYDMPIELQFEIKFSVLSCSEENEASSWLENVCKGLSL